MNERERVRRFNQALDHLISGIGSLDVENLTDDDRQALRLASALRDLDLSVEAEGKEALSQRLLAKHPQGVPRKEEPCLAVGSGDCGITHFRDRPELGIEIPDTPTSGTDSDPGRSHKRYQIGGHLQHRHPSTSPTRGAWQGGLSLRRCALG